MNTQQFNDFYASNGSPGHEHARYFAPEALAEALQRPRTCDEESFKEAVEKHFVEKYGNKDLIVAASVLCSCNESFKNRLNGTVRDEWFSSKTFKPIALSCITVLESLPSLEDYQKELIEKFNSF